MRIYVFILVKRMRNYLRFSAVEPSTVDPRKGFRAGEAKECKNSGSALILNPQPKPLA
jgi:hypothetical protein